MFNGLTLPMLREFFPFIIPIEASTIAGACLWAFALYIGIAPLREGILNGLERWMNWAERSLYFSEEEFEKDKEIRESKSAFSASLLSIVPFLLFGAGCNFGVEWSLGHSWAISLGVMACAGCGVYELGRLDGAQRNEEE